MPAPKGNKFWEARAKHGRGKIFESEEDLWKASAEYFEWVEDNPLEEEKLFAFQGDVTREIIHKLRPMTISGLCLFLNIGESTWSDYKLSKDFSAVCTRIDRTIYNQKFAGAVAELMNPNIIARDLGLAEKKETDNTHKFDLSGLSDAELERIVSGKK